MMLAGLRVAMIGARPRFRQREQAQLAIDPDLCDAKDARADIAKTGR